MNVCVDGYGMGQITIYLDQDTEAKARSAAEAEGVSLSSWIAHRIKHQAPGDWPGFVRDLAGAWPDSPEVAQLRKGKARRNLPREAG
jgi:hypothetical protein